MLTKLRTTVRNTAMFGLELVGLTISCSGTAIAIIFGKLFAAAILMALTLGIFLRLAGRRGPPPVALPSPSPWLQVACAFLSLVEVSALTEATNLPVRFNQTDFDKSNWALVVVALVVIYLIQIRLFRSLAQKRNANNLPSQS